MSVDQATSRRRFLQFLAASLLFAYGGFSAFAGEGPTAGTKLPDPIMWAPLRTEDLIKSPKDAINVFDFEPVCRANVPPAHFGYMASGVDDEVTLRANREGFLKFQLRPRRLVDVSRVDMSTEILGVKYDTPIIVAPVGGQKAFYTGGEIGGGKAGKGGNHLQILSTGWPPRPRSTSRSSALSRTRLPSSPPTPASTRSSSQTTARAARTAGARPSTPCRKSSKRSAAGCRSWSIAVFAAAPTSLRRSAW